MVYKTKVTTGRLLGKNIEIIDGLKAGEEVVVAGMSRLLDQSKVEVVR
jgi:multidrug efflux pump subunit AcrA (membrane-fusion protein)